MRLGTLAFGVAGGTPVLLWHMKRQLLQDGRLSAPTATAMYGVYAAHGLAVAVAARRRSSPLPGGPALTAVGSALSVLGSGLVAAGMSRFVGPGQVSGTDAGELATSGAYRFTRNPQYVGYPIALAGLGLTRRSVAVLELAAGVAAVFAWWVPVEERSLQQTFGEPYEHYLARTPRWLGRPRRRSRR